MLIRHQFIIRVTRTLMAAAMTAGLFCPPAAAQIGTIAADDLEQCRLAESMAELRLRACTTVIEDNQQIPEVRAEAFLNRGMAKEALGDIAGAISDYSEGLKLNPKYRLLYHRRGLAYEQQGDPELAIKDFSQAIQLDPTDSEALVLRGLTYASQGELQLALRDYEAALTETPDDDMVLVLRGEVREELGQTESARADYLRALELNPQNTEAKQGLERLSATKRD